MKKLVFLLTCLLALGPVIVSAAPETNSYWQDDRRKEKKQPPGPIEKVDKKGRNDDRPREDRGNRDGGHRDKRGDKPKKPDDK